MAQLEEYRCSQGICRHLFFMAHLVEARIEIKCDGCGKKTVLQANATIAAR